jgi:hypothetical protein
MLAVPIIHPHQSPLLGTFPSLRCMKKNIEQLSSSTRVRVLVACAVLVPVGCMRVPVRAAATLERKPTVHSAPLAGPLPSHATDSSDHSANRLCSLRSRASLSAHLPGARYPHHTDRTCRERSSAREVASHFSRNDLALCAPRGRRSRLLLLLGIFFLLAESLVGLLLVLQHRGLLDKALSAHLALERLWVPIRVQL